MANAKRCDICGKYFDLPDADRLHKTIAGRVELYKTAKNIHHTSEQEGFHFDACDDYVKSILDHSLMMRSHWETREE